MKVMSDPQAILVVDDQVENLRLLSDLLKPRYRVWAATSGAKALRLLDQGVFPELFLLDIMMPEMDGYELCRQIKARRETAQTPVVFLTAKTDSQSEAHGLQLGAVDFVSKPINPPVLLARVATQCALARSLRELRQERDEIHSQAKKLQHEIAERERAETQLRILAKAVEYAPVSIVVTHPDGRILYVNPYFSRLSGYSAEEAIGKNPRILKSGMQDDAFYKDLWRTITSGQTWRGELINQNKRGSLYWEAAAIAPILNDQGEISHYVGVKENISNRKELELIKDDVERIMRHDLKSSLNAVISFPELLLMDDNLTDDQREAISLIRDSGKKMHGIINLSLDLFKMETGQYQYQPCNINLATQLLQLRQLNASQLDSKNLRLRLTLDGASLSEETELLVRADERLLFSLLANLLINAIEASPPSAVIHCELISEPDLILALRNQGAVPEAVRMHFFEKYRTHGKKGGTGLGTYSAKLMADTMGMELRMETSDVDNSTCIALTLVKAN